MPMKPPTFRPSHLPSPAQARREYEQTRKVRDPWRRWFNTRRWQKLRADQLAREPLCAVCIKADRVTPANTAHHVIAHRGDEALFWCGELQSLCASCHSSIIQSEEATATQGSEWRR